MLADIIQHLHGELLKQAQNDGRQTLKTDSDMEALLLENGTLKE